MKVSRKEYLAARSSKCAIESGASLKSAPKGDVDLAELIRSWLADKTIKSSTLTQYAGHARKVAKLQAGGARLNPRKCLETLLHKLENPKPTEDS